MRGRGTLAEARAAHPLVAELEAASDPDAAEQLARYFQVRPGGYGEGDVMIGVKLSQIRTLTRPYRTEPFIAAAWLDLLSSPVHEHRLACLVVMAERAHRARRDRDGELAHLYSTYLAHTASVNNWDLVDVSCGPIVGGYLVDGDRTVLDRLARSEVVWERRIAIVATLRFLREGSSADTYRLAAALLGDPHDLIHKAVGWALREAGRRVDVGELRAFLDRYAATMPRTTLRYAIEHLDPVERRHYLGLKAVVARRV